MIRVLPVRADKTGRCGEQPQQPSWLSVVPGGIEEPQINRTDLSSPALATERF
tara:strand:- start:78 stop:236 length:159 start_codon:yes stop_codon:yes gene_type:complete